MAYVNADGLHVMTDGEEGITRSHGAYLDYGPTPGNAEVVIDFSQIGSTAAIPGGTGVFGISIPKNKQIEEVELFVENAFTSGGSATLDVGLVRLDRTTELDYDGLVAALALTSIDAKGEKVVLRVGSTGAGALIGQTLTNPGLVTVRYNTAAYTAGKLKVRIRWFDPNKIG